VPEFSTSYSVTGECSDIGELLELLEAPEWHSRAACKDRPDIDWFPGEHDQRGQAIAVCTRCPARQECLDWSLSQGPGLHGIWGGVGRDGRRRLRAGRLDGLDAAG
jgi:WhiB family redox-sensing transcriptional regulator